MTIELTGGWSQIRVPLVQSSGNFTAALNRDYTITATATVTDPTPAEGRLFTSLVVNGTATIGGTAYSTAGAMVRRRYHSGSWLNYVYPHLDGAWSWTAVQSFANGTAALPAIAFTSDPDTGIYRVSANALGIACNGVRAVQFNSATGQSWQGTYSVTDTANAGPGIHLIRSRATGTNGQVLSGDRIGEFRALGTDDTGAQTTSGMLMFSASENHTATAKGAYADLLLIADTTTSLTSKFRFYGDGGARIGSILTASPGLGVLTASVAVLGGATSRIGSESARFNGGTIATPTSTDVVTGGGAIAVGATTASTSTGTGSGTFAGGIGVAGQTTTAQIAVTTTTDSSTGTINALANPTGFIRLTGAAPDVRGLANPGTVARRVVLYCVNATTLTHEAGTASASDRITSDTGANIAVAAGKTVELIYDPTSTRWRPIRF